MNIGEAAKLCGLPPKTVRYYEEIGLLKPARAANGYRDYRDRDVHVLQFIQRSRSLGFSIDDARRLLSLYDDADRHSKDVKRLAKKRVEEIDRKIDELQSLKQVLSALTERCHGDADPDCAILDELGTLPSARSNEQPAR
ncbi:Cu(I)-responsive transcriptional regulator [Fulvimarina sp. 2208YS6-2-32]|uniref:Cu(I)-responsive transcriptional regulator n=1 Tax=Fulvimarina uroteuthidis TaxID=3098149 RepID=A0ABU5I243_9HYPH|nr:Cu(I)-responsive transcriptional regulator [Fulvimarina sp. 2208YS6-2-32]MDY8109440.1 Cu(I)-responsive transcriptional regulator [Fulvimarina sp. 2208YS6-2-32]